MTKIKLIGIGTPVTYTDRSGVIINGKIISARHYARKIRYELIDDKGYVYIGNSRTVKK